MKEDSKTAPHTTVWEIFMHKHGSAGLAAEDQNVRGMAGLSVNARWDHERPLWLVSVTLKANEEKVGS